VEAKQHIVATLLTGILVKDAVASVVEKLTALSPGFGSHEEGAASGIARVGEEREAF
jgi:hypothetical protein